MEQNKKNKTSACFIQGRTQGLIQSSINFQRLIQDESLISQDALDTINS